MLKDNHNIKYVTAAFRYYAALKLSYEELYQKYKSEALEEFKRAEIKTGGIGKPTENAVIYAENKLREKQGELWDVLAVEKTLNQLTEIQKKAVEQVYFIEPDKPIKKNAITQRVVKMAEETPADTRTIYRYLRLARNIFIYERGLRV